MVVPDCQSTTIRTVVAGREPLKKRTSPVMVALHRSNVTAGSSTIHEWL